MIEKKKRNQYEYDKKAYDHVHVQWKKGQKAIINDIAARQGESLNGYIKKAVQAQIKTDTGKDIEL